MTQYWAKKVTGQSGVSGLVPTTEETTELFARLNAEKPCRIEVKQPRNGKHSSKYWAILGNAARNTETYANSQKLHEAILMQLGMYEPIIVILPNGEKRAHVELESISYAAKDQAKFAEFYERAMGIIAQDLGFDIEELEKTSA